MSLRPATPQIRPWYRDGAAWTLVGSGVAALGAGLALFGVYGRPSQLAPVALSLAAGGAGMAGTGIALFFFQRNEKNRADGSAAGVTYGIALGRAF